MHSPRQFPKTSIMGSAAVIKPGERGLAYIHGEGAPPGVHFFTPKSLSSAAKEPGNPEQAILHRGILICK